MSENKNSKYEPLLGKYEPLLDKFGQACQRNLVSWPFGIGNCVECGNLSGIYARCGPCGDRQAKESKKRIVWTRELDVDIKAYHEKELD